MFKLLLLVINVSLLVSSQQLQGGSLDDLINSVFDQNNNNGNIPTGSPPVIIDGGGGHNPVPGPGPGPGPVPVPNPGPGPGPVPVPIPNPGPGPAPGPGPKPIPGLNPCLYGECVPYYQCANGSIITDGDGLLDIRIGEEENTNHPCPGLFETCCTLKSDKPIIPDVKVNEGCGFRNVDGVGFRITGDKDNEAQFGEFPWTVAVLKEESALEQTLNVYVCGGSLIDKSVVLTAAHCVAGKDPRSLKIRAGEWDTQTKDEIFPHQDREVVDYVIHENYYKGGLFNDVALLYLSQPVDIAENVNTVCLPPHDAVFDGSRCFASGWGKDLFGKEGKYQVILKRVELPIVPRNICVEKLRNTRLGRHFTLHESFICAGGERGKDTCKGDGGSPLVCPIYGAPNRYYQAGIVSWGIGCGDDTPGVYANIPLFRPWIDAQLHTRQIPNQAYNYQ